MQYVLLQLIRTACRFMRACRSPYTAMRHSDDLAVYKARRSDISPKNSAESAEFFHLQTSTRR